jgi:hypothetical protein
MVNNTTPNWVAELQENENGELLLTFPADFLAQMGWHENTELLWDIRDDGKITVRAKDGTKPSS